ncbi:glycosyltransferase family 2 protein [Tessaracoccus sp. Y36]
MSHPLVSVVVPVFNALPYLTVCLESLLHQHWAALDIVCVDDGSTDGSRAVLEEFAERDPRVRLIAQPNRGVSSARNTGLEHARGELLAFVDADDRSEPDLISRLVDSLDSDIDFVVEGAEVDELFGGSAHKATFLASSLRSGLLNSPCGRLYRRQIIDDLQLRFATQISLGEDLLFNVSYLEFAGAVRAIPGRRYIINARPGSLTRSFRESKYSDLMAVSDALSTTEAWGYSAALPSILNYLRIKALISTSIGLLSPASPLAPEVARMRIRSMQDQNAELAVPDGDLQMRLVGLLYRRVGLATLSSWVSHVKSVAACVRHLSALGSARAPSRLTSWRKSPIRRPERYHS